jgi:hypothetical protein
MMAYIMLTERIWTRQEARRNRLASALMAANDADIRPQLQAMPYYVPSLGSQPEVEAIGKDA